MNVALVLGAGGTVGLAYHTGVLRALEQVGGIVPDRAELIVGTSAGAVAGAYLRAGWTTEQLWEIALGIDPETQALTAEEVAARARGIMAPAFRDPLDLACRLVGSAVVAGRSLSPIPLRFLPMPRLLGRLFPAGVFDMVEGHRRFTEELPEEWPERPLWVCAVDIERGDRVVFGREGSPEVPLWQAVAASCAIPGLYPPVRVGPLTLVDGGVRSTTNLDLAVDAAADVVIGVAPLAFEGNGPVPWPLTQLLRQVPARMLGEEAAAARRRGVEVLLIRPTADDLRVHGLNLMRRRGWDAVARAAYDSAARMLERAPAQELLGPVAA